jgi:hypothetical protein
MYPIMQPNACLYELQNPLLSYPWFPSTIHPIDLQSHAIGLLANPSSAILYE